MERKRLLKGFFTITLFFLILFQSGFSQCDEIIHENSLGKLVVGESLKKKNYKKFGQYEVKRRIFNRSERRPRSFKTIYTCNRNVKIYTEKSSYFLPSKISSITITYPNNNITSKGIIIGKHTYDEVIKIYGKPNYHRDNILQYYYLGLTFTYGNSDLSDGENNFLPIKEKNLNNKIIEIVIYEPLPK